MSLAVSPSTATPTKSIDSYRFHCKSKGPVCEKSMGRNALGTWRSKRSESKSPLHANALRPGSTPLKVKTSQIKQDNFIDERDDTEDQENRSYLGNSTGNGCAKMQRDSIALDVGSPQEERAAVDGEGSASKENEYSILPKVSLKDSFAPRYGIENTDSPAPSVRGGQPLRNSGEYSSDEEDDRQEDSFPSVKEDVNESDLLLTHLCDKHAVSPAQRKRGRHAESIPYAPLKDVDADDDDDDRFQLAYAAEKNRREKASVLRNARHTTNPIEDDDEVLLQIPNVKLYEFLPAELRALKRAFQGTNVAEESKDSERSGNTWESCGVGTMKFLKHLEDGITYGTVRLAMRDNTNRLLVDQTMEQDVFCRPFSSDDNVTKYVWTGFDVSGIHCRRTLAAKFVSPEDAKRWIECFHQSKQATKDARLNPERRESPDDDDIREYLKSLSVSDSSNLQTVASECAREEKEERSELRMGVKKRRLSRENGTNLEPSR